MGGDDSDRIDVDEENILTEELLENKIEHIN